MNNKQLLMDCANQMHVNLTEEMADQFMAYSDLLLDWNEKMNLTAITDPREVVLKHFADCLSLVPYLELDENSSIIDVGTGAGFPGVPVKIACPDVEITLLDALQKRLTFLEEVTDSLALSGVNFVHSRAEDGGQNPEFREQFSHCVSRAVANMSVLAEYCLPYVQVGGYFVALKGPDVSRELEESKVALEILGGVVKEIIDIQIPYTELAHNLVIIEKIKETPKQYPRKSKKISQKPLA
ncbi:16S rRNA (guanine(527)-N(7))-methyltransferase RsmG [Chakrabartyella piscis]|uniref:16S rRNA (guanine(527)-N(7))-methyltransferase RsmG n=1 Tax=Chakrabartyella piscis TaxID=2918914 RepID=UPI0029584CB1|nr:16S rRNA (guanine(527)-N(7))-methyltransferase RsmG [Chakrabartyella piscis]